MANEITVNTSLSIRKLDANGTTELVRENFSKALRMDMSGNKGVTPGAITVKPASTGGTQVDLSALTRPGVCWIKNLGRASGAASTSADYFEYGIYDPASHKFYPLGEVWPGDEFPIPRLSRNIQEIYLGPGTGTAAGGETARLMLLSATVDLNGYVGAFEY